MKKKQVCIYCASSTKIPQKYFDDADAIVRGIVQAGHHIVYGGGAVGLMGQVANTALDHGGSITGIIPDFMKELEWNHPKVNEMIIVKSMAERKEKFLVNTDVVLALPGGSGTFEEVMEAITLKRLGLINAQILIYNQDGFYNGLVDLFDKAVEDKFMNQSHVDLFSFEQTTDSLLHKINRSTIEAHVPLSSAVVR